MTPIEDGWNELRATLPGGLSIESLAFFRHCFFAGALHYRDTVRDMFDHEHADELLVVLANELRQWEQK